MHLISLNFNPQKAKKIKQYRHIIFVSFYLTGIRQNCSGIHSFLVYRLLFAKRIEFLAESRNVNSKQR